ncbi:MAG TPA: transposase [Candidatus Acidoferrales bacterium]|nr:transposase [Candidatus Acidoferrales bacterium]
MTRKAAGWSSESFRAMALERLRNCTHVGRLCEELGISSATLRRWRSRAAGYEPEQAAAQRPIESLQQENERLKRSLGEKTLEVDFLQGALQQIEARRQQNTASGAGVSTRKSGE